MGQADPVSVFPGQQPVRKDPYGGSRVGCTGHGNPDDPVNLDTALRIKNPKLLPWRLHVSSFWSKRLHFSPGDEKQPMERRRRHHHLFIFSENTDLHLCRQGKTFSVWHGCHHTRGVM